MYAAAYGASGTVMHAKKAVDKTSLSSRQTPEFLVGLSKLASGDVSFTAYDYYTGVMLEERLGSSLAPLGIKMSLGVVTSSGQAVATGSDAVGNTAVLRTGEFNGETCQALRFDAAGTAIGTPITVLPGLSSGCSVGSLAVNATGAFAVIWAGGTVSSQGRFTDVYGQFFNADGSANGTSFTLRQGSSGIPAIASTINASGSLIVTWSEVTGQGDAVYARSISPQ